MRRSDGFQRPMGRTPKSLSLKVSIESPFRGPGAMFKVRYVGLFCALTLVMPAAFAAPVPMGKLTGALAWRSVGPYTGGGLTTVAGIADKPNVFYMGTAGGGLWETGDYGQTWRNISDRDFKS